MTSWSGVVHNLCSMQFLVFLLFLSLVSILLSSRTGGTLSRLNSLTYRLPGYLLKNLCFLATIAMSSLVSSATNTIFFLISNVPELRILRAAPAVILSRHLSIHFTQCSHGLFAPLAFWLLFVSLQPLFQTLRSCSASGAPRYSAMPPSLGRGRVTTITVIVT